MNLRDFIRPYTTLQITKIVLIIMSVQLGIRIFSR